MSTDLDQRLTTLGTHLDQERALYDGTSLQLTDRRGRNSHGWLGIAAAFLAIVGMVGIAALIRHRGQPQANESAAANTPYGSSTSNADPITLPEHGGDYSWSQFDPIRIAPGTVGWFDATGGLPDGLAAQRNDGPVIEVEVRSRYFRCAAWTIDADGPTCTQLRGGNGIDMVEYGSTLGIGVNLGPQSVAAVAEAMVKGGIIPYDATMPTMVDIAVDGKQAKLARVDQQAYLFWEAQPGAVVWLHSNGLTNDQLATIAAGVRPVRLPERMPLTMQLSPPANQEIQGIQSTGGLQIGWYQGSPCVGFEMHSTCYPADRPVIIDNAQWGDGMTDQIAAVAPAGSALTLQVDRYLTDTLSVPLTASVDGYQVAVADLGKERATAARLVDASGKVVTTLDAISTQSPMAAMAVVGEGRTDSVAWVVRRQDPAQIPADKSGPGVMYGINDDGSVPYCWLLGGPQIGAELCPPASPPTSGFGASDDTHERLNLIEIAADVTSVACAGEPMPILTDPQLANRRFAVISCDSPTAGP